MIIISWLISRIPIPCNPCLTSPIRPVLSIGCRHRNRLLHRVCTSNALLLANIIITNWMQHSSNHPEDMFIVSCLYPTTIAVSSLQCPQPMRLCHRIRSQEMSWSSFNPTILLLFHAHPQPQQHALPITAIPSIVHQRQINNSWEHWNAPHTSPIVQSARLGIRNWKRGPVSSDRHLSDTSWPRNSNCPADYDRNGRLQF